MANSKKIITMEIPADLMLDRLTSIFKKAGEPHAGLLVKAVLNNLEKSETGVQHLGWAFLGIEPKARFMVGDKAKIGKNKLSSYRTNLTAMIDAGIIVDDLIQVEVIRVDLYANLRYEFKYPAIDDNGEKRDNSYYCREEELTMITPVAPRNLGELL